MSQHGVHAPNTVSRQLCVRRGSDGFEQCPPVRRRSRIVRIGAWHTFGASGLVEPQFPGAHVGIQADSRSGIGAANPSTANGKPIVATQFLRFDEFQRGSACAGELFGTDTVNGVLQRVVRPA